MVGSKCYLFKEWWDEEEEEEEEEEQESSTNLQVLFICTSLTGRPVESSILGSMYWEVSRSWGDVLLALLLQGMACH